MTDNGHGTAGLHATAGMSSVSLYQEGALTSLLSPFLFSVKHLL